MNFGVYSNSSSYSDTLKQVYPVVTEPIDASLLVTAATTGDIPITGQTQLANEAALANPLVQQALELAQQNPELGPWAQQMQEKAGTINQQLVEATRAATENLTTGITTAMSTVNTRFELMSSGNISLAAVESIYNSFQPIPDELLYA